ncbi:unnamed protein product [Acanthoscelides obtectus]|uniref:Uncharacterized protein n=1 Tax=Acanthoscelides obtectus TaxID=200917 RepID=A0A9P0LFB0_ACAOB|nr:unnamed protein product [Acanthoscelides obtectus]CAK1632247.1 hypothetical protein AOBTE_LOCUS7435 [Acanthoscelides obtectus]
MARTRQTTPQTKEERLRQKREAERRRYYRLKQDPVGREQLRQKEIAQYLRKKEKEVIKPIEDLSERDRRKRKQWREYSQKYRNKKRQIRMENERLVRRMHEDTPPLSEEERESLPTTPENHQRVSGKRRYATNKRRSRENKYKHELIKKLQLKVQKYKQRYHRLKNIKLNKNDPSSPRGRAIQILDEDKKIVEKKLLFAEVMSDQLKQNYEKINSTKQKQIFRNVTMIFIANYVQEKETTARETR